MQTIAIINEKGGTAKTTSAVNLAAALGEMGKKVLLVDLDGQAASSRWMGVEDDPRLADALLRGGGLEPIADVGQNVDLAPGCGKLDSVAHELRPTQGGQLRRVLGELADRYDYALIDSPPSLANRLIGNAMLAADEALVPVETSILALDGLRILLTMLEDVRAGFGHEIRLRGVLACRYDARTRLSRLVLGELRRSLPGKVFTTVIRESVKLRECPAASESILTYAPRSKATRDYRSLAKELVEGTGAVEPNVPTEQADLTSEVDLDAEEQAAVVDFRRRASEALMESHGRSVGRKHTDQSQASEMDETQVDEQVRQEPSEPQQREELPEDDWEPPIPVADVMISEYPVRDDVSSVVEADDSDMQLETDSADDFGESPAPRSESDADAPPAPFVDADAGEMPQEAAAESDEDASVGFPLPGRDEMEREEFDYVEKPWLRKKRLLQVSGTAAGVAMLVGVFLLARGIVGEEAARHAAADEGRAIAVIPDNADVVNRPADEEQSDVWDDDAVVEASDEVPADVAPDAVSSDDADVAMEQPEEQFDTADADTSAQADEQALADGDVGDSDAEEVDQTAPAEPVIKYRKPPADMQLTCVLQGPTGYQALVNDEMLREGDILDGAKVLRITERTVEMELGGERFTLGFDEQVGSSGGDSETVAELVESEDESAD